MSDNKIVWVLQSRKFWAALIGLVSILWVAYQNNIAVDPDTLINAILGVVAAYIGAVALEDGLTNHNSSNTTVSTPAETVTISTEGKG